MVTATFDDVATRRSNHLLSRRHLDASRTHVHMSSRIRCMPCDHVHGSHEAQCWSAELCVTVILNTFTAARISCERVIYTVNIYIILTYRYYIHTHTHTHGREQWHMVYVYKTDTCSVVMKATAKAFVAVNQLNSNKVFCDRI